MLKNDRSWTHQETERVKTPSRASIAQDRFDTSSLRASFDTSSLRARSYHWECSADSNDACCRHGAECVHSLGSFREVLSEPARSGMGAMRTGCLWAETSGDSAHRRHTCLRQVYATGTGR